MADLGILRDKIAIYLEHESFVAFDSLARA